MKELPDFNVNISQAINYIFESDLAMLAFENPPFINYVNIVRKTIETIDRLSENCNMPEFTNHGLRHICSLIKRTSEWAISDDWISNIDSKEAGYLLMGILVHDLGMLSQETTDLPEDVALEYKIQNYDLATWVRKTHVLRLGKLLHRIFGKYEEHNPELKQNIDVIAQIASSHNYWPWEKQFELDNVLLNFINISKEKIRALNAIIAVVDLLDEDSERCDSETLIKHKKGNNINIAHWYRHALTLRVYPIKDHRVKIDMRAIEGMDDTFEDVFKVIRNQFKVILIYNDLLYTINANIDNIDFNPEKGMPEVDNDTAGLGVWREKVELKYSMKELLMSTFIPEARGEVQNQKLYNELIKYKLENVTSMEDNKLLNGDKLLFDDEELLYKSYSLQVDYYDEILEYYRKYIEHEFLAGNIYRVKNLCCMILENLDNLKRKDINKTYWLFTFLIYLLDSEQDYMLIRDYIEYSEGYTCVIKLVIAALDLNKHEYIKLYNKLVYSDFNKFNDDLETRLLFSMLVEYSYMFEDYEIINYVKEVIDKIDHSSFLYEHLNKVFLRLRVQFELIYGKMEKEKFECDKYIFDDEEKIMVKIWSDFFQSNALDLDKSIKKFSKYITQESKYYKSYMDLIVVTENIREFAYPIQDRYEKKKCLPKDEYTKHYRCLRQEFENQINVLENRRNEKIKSLLNEEITNNNSQSIERIIISGEIEAMRNWDIASFVRFRQLYAQFYEKMGELSYKKNISNSYLCKSIICWIQSLKSYDKKKYNHKFIGMIEVNEKDSIRKLYKFVLNNLAKVYWDNASTWLGAFKDLLPEDLLDDWIKWVNNYKKTPRDHMAILRLADLDFIEPIIKEYKFNDNQIKILEPILGNVCTNINYWQIQPDLCEAILKILPVTSCKNIIKDLTLHMEEKDYYSSRYINELIQLSMDRKELNSFIEEMFEKRYELYNNKDYLKYKDIIGKKYVKDFEKPDIIEISKEVDNILKEYENELKKGHHIFNNLSKVVELLSNNNWAACEKKSVDGILKLIKEFSIKNKQKFYHIEYNNVFSMLLALYNGASNECRMEIISSAFDIYGELEDAKVYLEMQKKKKASIDIEDGKVLGFLRVICGGIKFCKDEQLIKVIEWCMKIASHIIKENMIFYSYIFSYTYIYRELSISYSSLQALQLIIRFNDEDKNDYLYYILFGLKNFVYNMKNDDTNSFEKLTENKTYIKWIYNILDVGSKSIYYEKRELVCEIINNFKIKSSFEDILFKLKDDPRTSISNKLN